LKKRHLEEVSTIMNPKKNLIKDEQCCKIPP